MKATRYASSGDIVLEGDGVEVAYALSGLRGVPVSARIAADPEQPQPEEPTTSRPRSRRNGVKFTRWTPEDEERLLANAHRTTNQLARMFRGRTPGSIRTKLRQLQAQHGQQPTPEPEPTPPPKKRGARAGVSTMRWTEGEDEVIRLNPHATAEQLAVLPQLKRRTVRAIYQRKYQVLGTSKVPESNGYQPLVKVEGWVAPNPRDGVEFADK